jgi:hypothetical protein
MPGYVAPTAKAAVLAKRLITAGPGSLSMEPAPDVDRAVPCAIMGTAALLEFAPVAFRRATILRQADRVPHFRFGLGEISHESRIVQQHVVDHGT